MTLETLHRVSLRPALVSTLMLVALGGCDSRAGTEYQGEPLLTISGSVVVENEWAPTELVPALAFIHTDGKVLLVQDASVDGEFPVGFTLDVYDAPPTEAIFPATEDDGIPVPRMAIGFITAVTPDHPRSLEGGSSSYMMSCSPIDVEDPAKGQECTRTTEVCGGPSDGCYFEVQHCFVAADPTIDEVCDAVTTSGDEDLKRGIWRYFAGVSVNYVVMYLPDGAGPETATAGLVDPGHPLQQGYNLLRQIPYSPHELEQNEACRDGARADAFAQYNTTHGTSYTSSVDVPDESGDEIMEEIDTLAGRNRHARHCPRGDNRYVVVPRDGSDKLAITIGPDVTGPSLF